jgi:DNA-binding MarR family transcriptional regulator
MNDTMSLAAFATICDALLEKGLSVRDCRLLIEIHQVSGRYMTELAKIAKVSGSAMTGRFDELERRGLIDRNGTIDRRQNTAKLTDKGVKLLEELNLIPIPV